MRWISFAVLAGVFVILQTSLAPRVEILGVRPDWVFILVVFYALYASGPDAMLAGWTLGLLVDLCSAERFGLFALVYGLCALVMVRVRVLLYRGHPVTDVLVTAVFVAVAQMLIMLYRVTFVAGGTVFSSVGEAVLTSLYTALWAPYLLWCLRRGSRLLGTPAARRSRYAMV